MNAGELKPGEIGVAVESFGELIQGEEYEVLQVLEEGDWVTVTLDDGSKRIGCISRRCYFCDGKKPGLKILIPIRYLRRRRPPTWEDIRTSCGWAPTREVAPA